MISETFTGTDDFEACRKAEAWCEERGLSVGQMDRFDMRGILRGHFYIAKWHNLTKREIAALDGVMSGDMRRGPVHVHLSEVTGHQLVAREVHS